MGCTDSALDEASGISSLSPIGGSMSSGDEEWQIVKTAGTEEEATVVVGFLRSSGIPAEVESLLAHELPFDIGDLSEVRVRVPADRAEEARALLAASDSGAAEIDEPAAAAAPPAEPRE
jgi:hypothetical protein